MLPNGPAPRRLRPVRESLVAAGAAEIVTEHVLGYEQHRLRPLRKANRKLFKDTELKAVGEAVDLLYGRTASEASELSSLGRGFGRGYRGAGEHRLLAVEWNVRAAVGDLLAQVHRATWCGAVPRARTAPANRRSQSGPRASRVEARPGGADIFSGHASSMEQKTSSSWSNRITREIVGPLLKILGVRAVRCVARREGSRCPSTRGTECGRRHQPPTVPSSPRRKDSR